MEFMGKDNKYIQKVNEAVSNKKSNPRLNKEKDKSTIVTNTINFTKRKKY